MGTYQLRNNPELKIILNKFDFEIIDVYESTNSGKNLFTNFINAEFVPEKTNWFVTVFSFVTVIFNLSNGDIYKNRPKLMIDLVDKTIKINLFEVELNKVMEVVQFLNSK